MDENDDAPAQPPLSPPPKNGPVPPSHWLLILCLLGVDYFSTLSYQPSITYEVAGQLGPLATAVVVFILLFGVLPVYCWIAGRSPHGQGAIVLLERLITGWSGKTLVLVLLGFAATDFIMLKSVSVADAAEHLVHNSVIVRDRPLQRFAETVQQFLHDRFGTAGDFFTEQLIVAVLLGVLGFTFWFMLRRGFNRKVLFIAVPLVILYMLLNGMVIAAGLGFLLDNPERLSAWYENVVAGRWQGDVSPWAGNGLTILLFCILLLPQLSLGLSGFEMSLIVMPQVQGSAGDTLEKPRGRIRNTRKLLIAAALIMSIYLIGSALVTATLIPHDAFAAGGLARNRALAYLAHGSPLSVGPGGAVLHSWFGPLFGSLYDLITIIVLSLAGSSVMTALALLLPRFLLRLGMELKWANRWGILFIVFALMNMAITVVFQGSVEAQRGAYATGVLALLANASLLATIALWPRSRWAWYLAAITGLLVFAFVAVIVATPSGLVISSFFIGIILTSSVVSRALRTDELRTIGFEFADNNSKFLWDSLRLADFPVLVPHRPGKHERIAKEQAIRRDHQLSPTAEIVFLEIEVDDPSNFYQRLRIHIFQEDTNFVIKVTQCVSVAHAIAAIALEMSRQSKPPGLHFGWSEMDLLAASWSYLAFGEGNVPWKVRELILAAEPEAQKQPRVIIG